MGETTEETVDENQQTVDETNDEISQLSTTEDSTTTPQNDTTEDLHDNIFKKDVEEEALNNGNIEDEDLQQTKETNDVIDDSVSTANYSEIPVEHHENGVEENTEDKSNNRDATGEVLD